MKQLSNDLSLKARINYRINVYGWGNEKETIEVVDDCFREYCFIKGDKVEAIKFVNDIARLCGIKVKLDEG